MATFNETVIYLLARLVASQMGEQDVSETLIEADKFWKEIHKNAGKPCVNVSSEDVDAVYALYPRKCPLRGAALGKCAKNKAQIETLIKKYGFEDVYGRVKRYVEEAKRDQVYYKNFGTLLNNLPDYSETEETEKEINQQEFGWQ